IGDAIRIPIDAWAEQTAQRLSAMRSSFGDGHSIPVSCGAVNFPFPGRVLRELGFPDTIDPYASYTIPAPIAAQEKIDCLYLAGGRRGSPCEAPTAMPRLQRGRW